VAETLRGICYVCSSNTLRLRSFRDWHVVRCAKCASEWGGPTREQVLFAAGLGEAQKRGIFEPEQNAQRAVAGRYGEKGVIA